MRTLVVHEDESVRGALEMILAAAEHEVLAVDGASAHDVIARCGADVVVVDSGPEPQSRVELIRGIREQWPGTMVLVLLAPKAVPADKTALGRAAGTCRFLQRPFNQKQLLYAVAELARMAERTEAKSRTPAYQPGLLNDSAA
jgi:DNA-binding response OmpR family regulator